MTGAVLLADVGWLDAIGRSLREGFFMFWETLWPLILGFTLSGAVQAFVSRGDHAGQDGRSRAGRGCPSLRLRHGFLIVFVRGKSPWRSPFS